MKAHRIDAIDGLRGIAILLVIYQHVYLGVISSAVSRLGVYPWAIGHGWMGVSIFFILSGFVLGLPFFNGSAQMETRGDAWRFYARRSNRLLPLFVFMALVSFVVRPDLVSLLLTLSTGSMLTSSEFFPTINGPFWSLAIEIWFSILFPALLIAMARFGIARTTLAIAIVALSVRVAGTYFPFANPNVNPLKDSVLGRLDDFAIGVAIAHLYGNNLLPKLRSPHALLGVAIVALSGVLWDLSASMPGPAVSLFNIVTQCGVALVLVAALNNDTHIAAILSARPLRIPGAMCFSLYCWHGLLVTDALQLNLNILNQLKFWLPLMALSAMTYRYIEFPRSDLASIFRLRDGKEAVAARSAPTAVPAATGS